MWEGPPASQSRITLLAFAAAVVVGAIEVERRRVRDYPYVPATLSLLLGPRPPERVDALELE